MKYQILLQTLRPYLTSPAEQPTFLLLLYKYDMWDEWGLRGNDNDSE